MVQLLACVLFSIDCISVMSVHYSYLFKIKTAKTQPGTSITVTSLLLCYVNIVFFADKLFSCLFDINDGQHICNQ